jgi:hypothetical protein
LPAGGLALAAVSAGTKSEERVAVWARVRAVSGVAEVEAVG